MLEIKTIYGTFATYKDLYIFMLSEKIDNIEVTSFYNFSKINTLCLTLDDILKLI